MAPLVIVRNQASCQNLVESTKLERIKHDSKSARRKEKDEKKEKRKHKKEKHDKSSKRSHKHSSSKAESKKLSDECDQLEKSGLTEELEEPQNHLGYLSDGSQNSKKRRRDDSPPAVESRIKAAPVAGKPLRIRLIFKRPKVDESPSVPGEDLPVCSNSGAVSLDNRETVVKSVENSVLRVSEPQEIRSLPSTSAVAVVETKKVAGVSDAESLDNREKVAQAAVHSSVSCLKVSEHEENLPSTSAVAIAESKRRKKHRPSKEDRYNALFDNWDRPSLCLPALEIDSSKDDDDWLFGKRTQKLNSRAAVQQVHTPLQNKAGEVYCWPRAQFLPQVGIYSLPYTVPF